MYTIDDAPLSWRHIRVTAVASLGQLIGNGLATLVSVIIPLYQLTAHPELSSVMQGVVGAMDLIGIMIGSVILGNLSDRIGYIALFRLCPLMVAVAAVFSLIFPDITVLIISLFVMGFAIGGEYSLDSNYISVLMPSKWKFVMVGAAKATSALGSIIVAAVCFLMIKDWTDPALWPRLMWIIIAISGLMLVVRIRFWQSPVWLANHGQEKEAEEDVHRFLGPDVDLPPALPAANKPRPAKQSTLRFMRDNWRDVIFTGVPWACEGLGVYGIGIFLPILVMALGIVKDNASMAPMQHISSSVEITLWISCIMLPGFILGLLLIGKVKGSKIQTWGFLLSAASLALLLISFRSHWPAWISIGAFMLFELFLNMGPHLMTYVLPPRVYPVQVRGQGSGLAASLGKVGAVLGVFFIPILLTAGGTTLVLIVSIAVMALGALVTALFAPKGV